MKRARASANRSVRFSTPVVALATSLVMLLASSAQGQDPVTPTVPATVEVISTTTPVPSVQPSNSVPASVTSTAAFTAALPTAVPVATSTTVVVTAGPSTTTTPTATLAASVIATSSPLNAAPAAGTTTTAPITTTIPVTTTTRPPQIPLAANPLQLRKLTLQQQEILRDNAARERLLATVIREQESQRDLTQRGVEKITDARTERGPALALSAPPTNPPTAEDAIDLRRGAAIRDYETMATKDRVALIARENASLQKAPIEWFAGFVNPVQRPYSTSDTFGAPRVGHSHEGIDLFAERGTPVRATVDGVVRDVKKTPIGGRIAYVTSPDGTYYYYAHLDRWAPGLADGKQVIAGEVIGFVGRTGNAEATPPHVHFEIHPLGGGPINPFYIVDATRTKNRALFKRWTVPTVELCSIVAKEDAARANAIAASHLSTTTRTTTTKPRKSPPSTYESSTTIAAGVCPKPKAGKK